MAEWNHRICERCWFDGPKSEHPSMPGAFRMPVRVKDWGPKEDDIEPVEPGLCCYCGGLTVTGIFVREDENDVLCKGRHDESQWSEWAKVAVSEPPPPMSVVQGGLT